ncbi:MAG: trehalose 6-phosphate synthase, partial [Chlamydiota bacterium]|nr:trehalose 6-phosphate synthase [Chlamydiota bacterium]
LNYLESLHQDFCQQLKNAYQVLKDIAFKNCITDRDGTINNYCARYPSSIQSAYNAIFLSLFVKQAKPHMIILSSAPLDNPGLMDMMVTPDDLFIYAGSKGQDTIDKTGRRHQYPVDQEKKAILSLLNHELTTLIRRPEYEIFSYIGSGLQLKQGQTTVAYQDIDESIKEDVSRNFQQKILDIVRQHDPNGIMFRIEDTGKDLEIILTIPDPAHPQSYKDFDKADAVRFLNEELALHMEEADNLICGDTLSDIPMLEAAMMLSNKCHAVFVTKDESLKKIARHHCKNTIFLSEPDILIALFNRLAKKGRP